MRKFVAAAVAGFAALTLSSCASVPTFDKAVSGQGSLADPAHARGVNARLGAPGMQQAVVASVRKASGFRMRGTLTNDEGALTVDIHYGRSSSSGLVRSPSTTLRFRYTRGVVYFNGDERFWRSAIIESGHSADSGVGRHLLRATHGKWVRMGKLSEAPADVRSLVTPGYIAQEWGKTYNLTRGPNRVVHGLSLVSFVMSGTRSTTVYVPADGRVLPARVEASAAGGSLDFSQWNKPYTAKRPSKKQTVSFD